jgi:phage repressor protein C with HTH and peptisase S24 domain
LRANGSVDRLSSDEPEATAAMLRRIAQARPHWIDVHGSSMGWSIPDGAKVRVESGVTPRRGDVWVFCSDDGVVLVHRCRGEVAGGFRFQGDARSRADGVVAADQLVGRVVEVSPARARLRWGRCAGALQRVPRVAYRRLRRALGAERSPQ